MTNTLYLAWREPGLRWWPVGRLVHENGRYEFRYTKGASSAEQAAGFRPIPSFPELSKIYSSEQLFPLFANRLLSKSRPDYQEIVEWLDLASEAVDPMAFLARSGGHRETDMFEVFPVPERSEEGYYRVSFFVHGFRYCAAEAEEEARRLKPGDPLVLQEERENPHDSQALKVLVAVRGTPLGYVPRYLCRDVHFLRRLNENQVNVSVKRINLSPAPTQFRVLCILDVPWPSGFKPLSGSDFEPRHDQ